jgi:outer membrane protein assembly factor BamE
MDAHNVPTFSRFLRPATASLVLAATLSAAGCSSYQPNWRSLGVYKLDINQGNFLTDDQVEKLKVGQTKQQVRAILGSPLLTDAFHQNRWDYVYEFRRQGVTVEHRNFAVFFDDDKLARWEGDEMPKSIADLNKAAAERTMAKMPAADDPGWLGWLVDLFKK